MITLLLVVGAVTVDLGTQRVLRRDLQALADVAALDLSRQIPGKSVGELQALAPAVLNRVLAANNAAVGDRIPASRLFQVEFGAITKLADGSTHFDRIAAADAFPSAVRVVATNEVGFGFARVIGVDSGGSTRSAVARVQGGACVRVGSFLARVDTARSPLLNPLLSGLLGSTVNLSAVSYTGLANANLTLAELARVGGLGVATPEEVLALGDLSVQQFFLASARVLDAQGKRTEADVLRSLSVAGGTPTIKLAELIYAAPGSSSALDAQFNVLALVQGAAMLAHEGSAVSVPGLTVALGLANVTASLNIVEAPQFRCGPVGTEAATAQVRLSLTTRIPAQSISVPDLGAAVTLDAADVTLDFDLGRALARLTAVTCAGADVTSLGVQLRSSVLGSLRVSANVRARADFTVPLLGGGGVLGGLLSTILSTLGLGSLLDPPRIVFDNALSLSGGTTASSFSRNLTLPIPGSYTVPVGSGSGAVVGDLYLRPTASSTLTLSYRGLLTGRQSRVVASGDALFNQVLSPLVSQTLSAAINPLISNLQTNLVAPLTALLGVQYGGADVSALPTATCAAAGLVD